LLTSIALLVAARFTGFAFGELVAAWFGASFTVALFFGAATAFVGGFVLTRGALAGSVGFLAGALLAAACTIAGLGAARIAFTFAGRASGRFLIVGALLIVLVGLLRPATCRVLTTRRRVLLTSVAARAGVAVVAIHHAVGGRLLVTLGIVRIAVAVFRLARSVGALTLARVLTGRALLLGVGSVLRRSFGLSPFGRRLLASWLTALTRGAARLVLRRLSLIPVGALACLLWIALGLRALLLSVRLSPLRSIRLRLRTRLRRLLALGAGFTRLLAAILLIQLLGELLKGSTIVATVAGYFFLRSTLLFAVLLTRLRAIRIPRLSLRARLSLFIRPTP
jgi:hypothetical protein